MKRFFLIALMTGICININAQTTGAQLKTQIDTDITNKTGAGSITKAAVGGNMKSIVDYVDQESSKVNFLEYTAQVYQESTTAPQPQQEAVNTLEAGFSGDSNYKGVVFARTAVGTYTLQLRYSNTLTLDTSKVAISLPDGARVTAVANGGAGALLWKQYTFKTYTPAGVEADGILAGNNGGYVTVKLYQ